MMLSLVKITAVVAAALLIGKLVSRLKLPSILGWLLAGMLLGPHGLKWMDSGILDALWYQNTIHVLECAVGLMIGTELVWSRIRKSGKAIIITVTGNLPSGFRRICRAVFPKRHIGISGFCIWWNRAGYSPGTCPFHRKGIQNRRAGDQNPDSYGRPGGYGGGSGILYHHSDCGRKRV